MFEDNIELLFILFVIYSWFGSVFFSSFCLGVDIYGFLVLFRNHSIAVEIAVKFKVFLGSLIHFSIDVLRFV